MTAESLEGPGVRVHAGVSGAGKTHGIRAEVWDTIRAGNQVCVIDRVREWDSVPPDIARETRGATDIDGALSALDDGALLVILRPSLSAIEQATIEIVAWAIEDKDVLRGVAIPEAHRAIPKKFDARDAHWGPVQTAITEWRHANVALWCDTQRFALLNTDLVELARQSRLFAMSGRNDLAAVRALGGSELEDAVRECAARLDDGEPGWHVRVGFRRSPPYLLVREGLPGEPQEEQSEAHAHAPEAHGARSRGARGARSYCRGAGQWPMRLAPREPSG